eukprot:GHRQ01031906.1.p1 GENE.GHRQ01031906.1~~GHRQ01031906.1.p1  ORF type:complete len:178 (+),score=14.11 GHRQ01031906.1:42-575(+)
MNMMFPARAWTSVTSAVPVVDDYKRSSRAQSIEGTFRGSPELHYGDRLFPARGCRLHPNNSPCRKPASMALTPITTSLWGMEYSVHACPPAMTREIQSVFPDVDLSGMLVVPTCQQADYDLVRTGEKVELEKDRLLERFMVWAKCVCGKLQDRGYWCDYIDPCSGLPVSCIQGLGSA